MSFTSLGSIAEGGIRLPLCSFKVPVGFPSPATDPIDKQISLDQVLNIRVPHVYLVLIDGDSMEGSGICSGDLAVVDISIEPVHGNVVVALLNNYPI